ncbi:tyrosine-protein kinase STYK1 isoform B [Alligator mississippiensis]|uniref:Tyrosine-protein kinase STYK1 isoform B n=1 Tax=Alligator mississippiensis TaxID=8496 RepID=A0A151P6R8_ALLMI|nr:tyrosine-protein kinase STYK1 isoform B [Alligator mississippiensis]
MTRFRFSLLPHDSDVKDTKGGLSRLLLALNRKSTEQKIVSTAPTTARWRVRERLQTDRSSGVIQGKFQSSNDQLCVVREYQTEVIIIPVFLVGMFVIVLSVILWLRYQSWKTNQQQQQQQLVLPGHEVKRESQQEPNASGNSYIQLSETTVESLLKTAAMTLKELQIPRERLSPGSLMLIHTGSYGGIYRAELQTENPGKTKAVILKTLQDTAGPHDVKDFLGRIKFHQSLGQHENLVELVGCCIDQLPLYMVLKESSLGDLLNFLWICRKDVMTMDGIPYDLTEKQVYKVGQQVAAALARGLKEAKIMLHFLGLVPEEYLSSAKCSSCHYAGMPGKLVTQDFLQQKQLVHGDIAARNVLLQHDFTAKLCGLGLAYETYTYGARSITQVVPLKWQAPERLLKRPPSIKADIWSFGILLYEMITLGAPPYPEVPPLDILQHLQRQNIMKQPSSCQPVMYGIMQTCWQWNATDRPSPAELLQSLNWWCLNYMPMWLALTWTVLPLTTLFCEREVRKKKQLPATLVAMQRAHEGCLHVFAE